MPSAATVVNNDDGTVSISYTAKEDGFLTTSLVHNEVALKGFPIQFHVDSSKHIITAYGAGLFKGFRGQTLSFYVVCGQHADEVEVSVEGPKGEVNLETKLDQHNQMVCTYVAKASGEYHVSIKRAGQHIKASPFLAKIVGDGRKRSVINLPAFGDYTLGGPDVTLANLCGQIKNPDGEVVPVTLKRMPNRKLGISSFQPKSKGVYNVEVMQEGDNVMGSPFQIHVGDMQLCSPTKVKVSGDTSEAKAGVWNEMHLDLVDAGIGALAISVEGSHTFDLESKTPAHGEEVVIMYRPHEPGIYVMYVKFGTDHVSGSPFMLSVTGEPSGKKRQLETLKLKEAVPLKTSESAVLFITLPGLQPLDFSATLSTPSATVDDCEIRDKECSLFEVKVQPFESGLNVISLKQKGVHIRGSPFQYTVDEKVPGGAHRVDFLGLGSDLGFVESKNYFNVYVHEAGAGMLSVGIDGPSQAKISMHDTGTGFVMIWYEVETEGEYFLGVKFNGEHVPRSPKRFKVPKLCTDAMMVTFHSLKEHYEAEKPIIFSINNHSANGVFDGYVIAPNGAKQELVRQEIDNEITSCRFLPRENGIFWVHITFNENNIPDSPMSFVVGALDSDPALVRATGYGLKGGSVDKPCRFLVDTEKAGYGVLSVVVEGPSKANLNCKEVDGGFEFEWVVSKQGVYLIKLNFCYVDVPGCPFRAVVGDKSDASDLMETSSLSVEVCEKSNKVKQFIGNASKVSVEGKGLHAKCLSNRVSTFNIDIKEAGHGFLTIAMISPTGHPVKELSYKKHRHTSYIVTYTVEEKGEHLLYVQWGDRDVVGSPFTIVAN